MCRLLLVRTENEFKISKHLSSFADISKNSKEFQGHGWGCSYLNNGKWNTYRNIQPIWEDNLEQFNTTNLLIGHARSAFKDEGIVIENNMPFEDDKYIFIFNGELHGVKLNVEGRIGAEKIFNFIRRMEQGSAANMLEALQKSVEIIKNRSRYIKSMNIIIVDKETNNIYLSTMFNEDEDYFTMHYKENENGIIICSDSYQNEEGWTKIENNTIKQF
ncbi:hypothetical protein HN695_01055 [Candidatus Woesearchaeota archaeon]|jgi:predicted glutamine amidotransferase|nr:hypothetical protein [Candidatus Woesearchaeota archaeon]MBT5272739.1 hypothetical protein [Candidatus Woesearchaeota archaeon]MBT6040350.1 hypothetical protein [Candidatus Woesearchaeota archaeon]MBT6337016.1 hypothetical protein [Candidatus Woesearchaeota archaeon]MBT7926902.1 hypothetical protein [Candidatus Woesearchaeota archaeon]